MSLGGGGAVTSSSVHVMLYESASGRRKKGEEQRRQINCGNAVMLTWEEGHRARGLTYALLIFRFCYQNLKLADKKCFHFLRYEDCPTVWK